MIKTLYKVNIINNYVSLKRDNRKLLNDFKDMLYFK